jgi:hypothetical protein
LVLGALLVLLIWLFLHLILHLSVAVFGLLHLTHLLGHLVRFLVHLLVDIESLGIADFRCDPSDLGKERLELLLPRLRVALEVLNQLIVLLLLDQGFQVLDVLVQLRGPLLDGLDVAMEGLSLCKAAVMHKAALLDDLA